MREKDPECEAYERCVAECGPLCDWDTECMESCEAWCDDYYLPEFCYDDEEWEE